MMLMLPYKGTQFKQKNKSKSVNMYYFESLWIIVLIMFLTAEHQLTVKVTKKIVKTYMSIIECDPATFQRIMLKSEGKFFIGCKTGRVYECYNCCQYGHLSHHCKNQKVCGKCNSTSVIRKLSEQIVVFRIIPMKQIIV